MKKWLLGLPLVLISVFIWLPLWMLISGTFMGGAELSENLAPVLEGRGGTAVWPVMARYPTLAAYVELLLDTPQFFTVFWNSCRQVFPIILGHVLLGAPAAWAFAKFHFRGKKILYTLYIVLMLMPFQVTSCGIGLLGILERNRSASGILKKPGALAAVIIYVKHHGG